VLEVVGESQAEAAGDTDIEKFPPGKAPGFSRGAV